MSRLKQRFITTKTDTTTLTLAEMGEIFVNKATAINMTLPDGSLGLWYRIINIGNGTCSVKNSGGTTLQTLFTNESSLFIYNGTSYSIASNTTSSTPTLDTVGFDNNLDGSIVDLQSLADFLDEWNVITSTPTGYSADKITLTTGSFNNNLDDSIVDLQELADFIDDWGVITSTPTSYSADRITAGTLQLGDDIIASNDDGSVYMDKDGIIVQNGKITVKDINGNELFIDGYGIDPTFLRWFPNMLANSEFTNAATPVAAPTDDLEPRYWSGGMSSYSATFIGQRSLVIDEAS